MADGWVAHREADARRRSAIRLAQAVLSVADELAEAHLKEALSIAIWKYTEANGKNKTRYRSRAAIGAPASEINHEHVVTRKSLIAEMIKSPDGVEEIMSGAVACCVLRTEHSTLAAVEKESPELTGWDRYKAAGIEVIDLATGETVRS
jgi:hypothetical protein